MKIMSRFINNKVIPVLLAAGFAAILFLNESLAKEINFEATVERNKVSLGQSLKLNFTFRQTQDMPALELPEIDGFISRYLGPSTSMSIINGQVSSSITHVYTLLPDKTGQFKIGPLKFEYKSDTYLSNPVNIEVVESQQQADIPADTRQQNIGSKDLADRIFLMVQAGKDRVYLNQLTSLTIKLYVNRIGVRDIQFPKLDHEGLSVSEFEQPKQYQEVLNGVNYDVIEFGASVFGLRPGEFRLGPVSLSCNLVVKKEDQRPDQSIDDFFNSNVFDNFFGRYETYPLELKGVDIPITVLDLPQENKPDDFSQAIGDFTMDVAASPLEVKVGDPVTLRVVIRGEGNFNTVNMPAMRLGGSFKAYDPQIKQESSQKSFEQILMPLNDQVNELPELFFSFFNPRTGKYESISKGPFSIKVLKSEQEERSRIIGSTGPALAAPEAREENLGRDIVYIKDTFGSARPRGAYLYNNKIFWFFQLLPLAALLLLWFFHSQEKKLRDDIKYARRTLAPRKARRGLDQCRKLLDNDNKKEFFDLVFNTLQEYLGDRFHLKSQAITSSVIDEVLRPRNIPADLLSKLGDIFKECDMARYAVSGIGPEAMSVTLKKLEDIIDFLERNKV